MSILFLRWSCLCHFLKLLTYTNLMHGNTHIISFSHTNISYPIEHDSMTALLGN